MSTDPGSLYAYGTHSRQGDPMDTRGASCNGGAGWPPVLAKDSQFTEMQAAQQNQHAGH